MEYGILAGLSQPPPDPPRRRLEGGNKRLQAHLAKGNNDAEGRHGALPAVQHRNRDPPRVRVHDAGQLGIAPMGGLAEEGAEILRGQPCRSDR